MRKYGNYKKLHDYLIIALFFALFTALLPGLRPIRGGRVIRKYIYCPENGGRKPGGIPFPEKVFLQNVSGGTQLRICLMPSGHNICFRITDLSLCKFDLQKFFCRAKRFYLNICLYRLS
jgi:hypothetical protein